MAHLESLNTPMKNFYTDERKAFWLNRRVFITGGFGLLGSALVETLHDLGAHLVVLQRDMVPSSRLFELEAVHNITIVRGDFEDYDTVYRALHEYEIETVFHVGAQPIAPVANRAPLPTLKANIMGTVNVLEAARLTSSVKRVLVASSDKAYGPQPVLPYTEDAPLQGNHPYDVSKSCTDLISLMYHNTYKLPVCVTRCGNLYGPGDLNFSRIIPDTIVKALTGRPVEIRSDGLFIRDYFFVKDAAMAYITLAEHMDNPEIAGQAFNFSTGNCMNVLQVVDKILEAVGRPDLKPIVLNQAKAEIHDQTLSSEKANRVLGWKTYYTIEEGMKETVEWYKKYLEKKQV